MKNFVMVLARIRVHRNVSVLRDSLLPFSAAALSVNMKCWKRQSGQRLDIWHSCPTQRDTSQLSRASAQTHSQALAVGDGHLGPGSGKPAPPPKARQ